MTRVTGTKYDVAISFLSADMKVAEAIDAELEKGLRVFFFPRRQEELAGTDGLQSMRDPFLDATVIVILHRERWGNTPWTGVEQVAIKDRMLDGGWPGLMMVKLNDDPAPRWVPHTHINFALADFGVAQLVGAIKGRVSELGGVIRTQTMAEKAALVRKNDKFAAQRKDFQRSGRGVQAARGSYEEIRSSLVVQAAKLATSGTNIGVSITNNQFTVLNGLNGVTVLDLSIVYSDSLDEHSMTVEVWDSIPQKVPGRHWLMERLPRRVSSEKFEFDLLSPERAGWCSANNEFDAAADMAEHILGRYLEGHETLRKK